MGSCVSSQDVLPHGLPTDAPPPPLTNISASTTPRSLAQSSPSSFLQRSTSPRGGGGGGGRNHLPPLSSANIIHHQNRLCLITSRPGVTVIDVTPASVISEVPPLLALGTTERMGSATPHGGEGDTSSYSLSVTEGTAGATRGVETSSYSMEVSNPQLFASVRAQAGSGSVGQMSVSDAPLFCVVCSDAF